MGKRSRLVFAAVGTLLLIASIMVGAMGLPAPVVWGARTIGTAAIVFAIVADMLPFMHTRRPQDADDESHDSTG